MSQAAEAYTTNVVPFRRAANEMLQGREQIRAAWEAAKDAQETPAPTQSDVQALLISALVLALPLKATATFRRRLRMAYETAHDPHYKETARLAAEAFGILA